MRRGSRFLMSVSMLVLLCLTMLSPASAVEVPFPAPATSAVIPGRYIVLLKADASLATTAVLQQHRITALQSFQAFEHINGFSAALDTVQLALLKADPSVQLVEPDYVVHAFASEPWWKKYLPGYSSSSSSSKASSIASSSSLPSESSSSNSSASSVSSSPSTSPSSSSSSSSSSRSLASSSVSSQPVPTGIRRVNGDRSNTARIDGRDDAMNIDIAIIDTGVDASHPDLHVMRQVNFTSESTADDRNGHGTHVAGTAAAIDNGIGVVGTAPGARIWGVKVLDRNGSGTMSDIIEGIDYVTANAGDIDVANMSLGCNCTSTALNEAINRSIAAGVVYVVAAGNDGKDATTYSPANHPKVITVSAVADFNGLSGGGAASTCRSGTDDALATFSNYGAPVDLAAPGVCIFSTWKGGGYSTISGTSMASPHVAGAAALLLSTRTKPQNEADVAAVLQALRAGGTANDFTGDKDSQKEPFLNLQGL